MLKDELHSKIQEFNHEIYIQPIRQVENSQATESKADIECELKDAGVRTPTHFCVQLEVRKVETDWS